MSIVINPNKQFAEKARLSQHPYKGFPKNIREAFSIAKIHENGIFQIEDGVNPCLYDRCYVFSDINYIDCDEGQKDGILNNVIKFLNFMNTDFKITIANEYRNMREFINGVFSEQNKEEYPDISKGMHQWMKQKIKESELYDLEKVLYLTITVRSYSYEDARSYFLGMDVELKNLFETFKSEIYPIDAVTRLNCIRKFFYQDTDKTLIQFSDDPLHQVLPYAINASKRDYMEINNDMFVSVLFSRSVDSALNDERLIHRICNVSYPSFYTLDYAPVERALLKTKLENANVNNDRAISNEIDAKRKAGQAMAGISYTKSKKRDELEAYMDQMDSNNESCILTGFLAVVTADSKEELYNRVVSIQDTARGEGIHLETYNYVQLKALNTALPIGCRQVNHMRAFFSSSLVSMHPFYAEDLIEEDGQLYGINKTTNHLVFANRKCLKSPHGMIVGHTGGGKSYLIKETEVAQTLLSTDDDLTMIDPQNEMEGICSLYGGEFLDFTPKSTLHINPMEISEELFFDKDKNRRQQFVSSVIKWCNSFCEAIMYHIEFNQTHKTFVGQAVQEVYDTVFSKKHLTQPTIVDVRAKLKEKEDSADNFTDKECIHQLYNALSEYTEGIYDMFAYPSNVDMNNRFVVFGLAHVGEDFWEPVMITMMFFLTNRMEYNKKLRRATRLVIDETQVVTNNASSARMLLDAVVTYRKFGGIVTMALQNLSRALDNPALRDMFSNCGYKCFLDQGGVDANRLAEIQELSAKEFASLAEDTPGHGVMVWGKKIILLDATMDKSNILYQHFSTNFHEGAVDESR
ncbi:MAG: hypothetical protein K6F30_04665 [Lachnospiraceae bacterium]|nr:hypothetical protein [Lachnospiraceae bacterium]